ncbi:hypothetical protein RFI_02948, partial [Reticulomyxa filosa]
YSNITNYNQLNKIIDCMDTGKTVILHNLDSIYESLYDMCYGIIIYFFSVQTQIIKSFQHNIYFENIKEICIVEWHWELKVGTAMFMKISSVAFLSRFEKQFISYRNSLPTNINEHVEYAKRVLIEAFKVRNLSDLFCGYCEDTIFSALLYLAAQKAIQTDDIKDDEKKEQVQISNKNLNDITFDDKELKLELLDLFRPLCRPEEIVKMQIEEDIRFLSLRKKSKDQMAIVITNDMEYNIPMEWIHRTKKISSFKKVDQFEKTVKEFFKDEPSEDILILQCRYMSDSKDQLEQIIHILQFEHYQFYNDSNNSEKQKLVILLIHSSRESSKKSIKELNGKSNKELSFPLIFRQFRKTNHFFSY